MFESLSTRLQDVFKSLRGESRLTPENIEVALREIRLALLEADVNFKVVKAFIDRVRDRAVDQEVLRSLTPDQQVVRIVRDEMLALFGDAQGGLPPSNERPRVIMLLGLQGSGKTTTSAKLGRWLTKQGRHPMLVSTDVRRPAAIEQLAVVGKQAGVRVHDPAGEMNPVRRAAGALDEARNSGFDVVIVDTAGRLHTQTNLMEELAKVRRVIERKLEGAPHETLLVVDATTGQNGVQQARLFKEAVGVTGVALTKLDGSAKGGVAIPIAYELGLPVKLVGVGEQLADLRPFDALDYARALVV